MNYYAANKVYTSDELGDYIFMNLSDELRELYETRERYVKSRASIANILCTLDDDKKLFAKEQIRKADAEILNLEYKISMMR